MEAGKDDADPKDGAGQHGTAGAETPLSQSQKSERLAYAGSQQGV